MEGKPIYVAYVGIGDIEDREEIGMIMKEAYDAIFPIFEKQDGEVIFIPIRHNDSKIECINPKYITGGDLIRKNSLLMDELHVHLDAQLESIKEQQGKKNKDGE